jgi:hypothetical protein
MLIPFKNGDLWHLNLESDFLNFDEKIESFRCHNASVETKRLVVYGDRESDATDDECDKVKTIISYNDRILKLKSRSFNSNTNICRGNKTFTTCLFLSPVMMWHTHI